MSQQARLGSQDDCALVSLERSVGPIRRRVLLPFTITQNATTRFWVVSFHTDQRAMERGRIQDLNMSIRSCIFSSETEARTAALAFTPPRKMPLSQNPSCFLCDRRFTRMRRPRHCRNCGVCACNKCLTSWSARMVPKTYVKPKMRTVRVCKSCDKLNQMFNEAVTAGNYERALLIHSTGNINLRTPFVRRRGESMYPVHSAVMGGDLRLLRWLVDEHRCPIKSPKQSDQGVSKDLQKNPLVTSKGRSVLQIAATTGTAPNVEIVRYLVIHKRASVEEIKDLATAQRVLDAFIRRAPTTTHQSNRRRRNAARTSQSPQSTTPQTPPQEEEKIEEQTPTQNPTQETVDHSIAPLLGGDRRLDLAQVIRELSFEPLAGELPTTGDDVDATAAAGAEEGVVEQNAGQQPDSNVCIICCDSPIDCVIIPCGHQICCFACSRNLHSCPICNSGRSTFTKVFRP